MDIKSIKELAQQYAVAELEEMANKFEETGLAPLKTQDDPGDQMSDYLMGAELRKLIDQGLSLPEAVREFSKRIRGVLS
jgi:hypothetical protein